MRILNITKREDTEYNSYCLSNHTPYSHNWMFLWKINSLTDLFHSFSIAEAEWCIYASVRINITG